MVTLVLSLGGSTVVPDKVDVEFLKQFKKIIVDYAGKGNRVIIVTGGGAISRNYIDYAKQLSEGAPQEDLDWVGIKATALNAELVRCMFGKLAYEEVVANPTEQIKTNKKIIIGCGWLPGCSTDKDAVLLAENFKAKTVVNITNVDYVYDKNPKQYSDAKPVKEMSWEDMTCLVGDKWVPGANLPFDPIASKKAEELGLTVIIMGNGLGNFKKFLEGKKFKGTIIK